MFVGTPAGAQAAKGTLHYAGMFRLSASRGLVVSKPDTLYEDEIRSVEGGVGGVRTECF